MRAEENLLSTETATPDLLSEAHRALADHAWPEALRLLQEADREKPLSGPDLEKLAEAAFFNGQGNLVIEAKERAFKADLAAGDRARAAALAVDLCREYLYTGRGSIGSAWLRRAERLLEDEPEGYAHGYLALAHAQRALQAGEVDEALELGEKAVRLGSRYNDADLEAHALASLGTTKISTGSVREGLELLEEATVAAANGELSPFTTGVTYCQMISVCRDLSDYARAGQWTEATTRWCDEQSISGFPGVCRVHRAEVVAVNGGWEQAEKELEKAAAELEAYNATPPRADAFFALAHIRYRRGDYDRAEEALRQAHALGKSPQPILALIRLAQGQARSALSAITAALEEQTWDQWARIRLLPAQVEIAIAAGELDIARSAAEELEHLAATYDAPAVQAESDAAWGRLLLAEGDPLGASRRLRQAIEKWGSFYAPYEVGVARTLLAAALRALHDEDAADLELSAAYTELERLGATPAAEAVRKEIERAEDRRTGPTQTRKTFMFTDIVGSTNLAELLGDKAWDQLLRWHDEALRAEFARHGGEVVNSTGDGFFVAFDTARQAVDCARAVQRLLEDHRRGTGFAPMVRIGLHAAEANRHGADYTGVGVHVAARVAALAGGGEIVASVETLTEAGSEVAESRPASLKGVKEPVEVAHVDWAGA
ncbi:MAG TPA: adenylate/guanylate cyclase domain-containing protein [Acidimicrobiia bacterium]|nr:adenylate/guanylate cyclase domain-containing protein [Acidimicrobiia bacterium]